MAFHRAGRHDDAERIYRSVLTRDRTDGQAQNLLGLLLVGTGRPEEGLELMRQSVKRVPKSSHFHINLAEALQSLGRLAAAEDAAKRAINLAPSADAHCKLGFVLTRRGRLKAALGQFERATQLSHDHHDAWHNVGALHAQLWSSATGASSLRKALALAPARADTMSALGGVFQGTGQLQVAISLFQRALGVLPSFGPAHVNLGTSLSMRGETRDAIRHLKRALSLLPAEPSGWMNLGNVSQYEGQVTKAEAFFRRVLALSRQSADAWGNVGRVLHAQGRRSEALAANRQALAIDFGCAEIHSNILFSMLSDPAVDAAAVLAESRRWERQHAPPRRRASLSPSLPSNPDRRLVVGYLSGDFRRHPVAGNIEELLRRHDRQRFSVHCYAEIGAPDAVTERFRALADRWVPTIGMDDAAVAERIRNDGVDILVFLGGHTASNRLAIAAYRSAPIQVSFHAPATTGLTTIDYWLTDASLSPAGSEVHFSEQLYRLPTFYTFQAPPAVPIAGPQPAGADVVFGSFNNPTKLNDRVFDAWAQILAQLPRSRLRLGYHGHFLDPALQGRVLAALAGVPGVDGRVEFLSAAADGSAHFARLGQTDIILDTFPFAGATSTFEALWMGVPVVTLAGESFVGRVGVSLAPHVGLADFVAPDQDAYVDRAVRLAQDEPLRMRLRRSMRERLTASPLMDYHAQTLDLEQAYKNMWKSG